MGQLLYDLDEHNSCSLHSILILSDHRTPANSHDSCLVVQDHLIFEF